MKSLTQDVNNKEMVFRCLNKSDEYEVKMDNIAIFLHYINENAVLCFLIIFGTFFINKSLSYLLFISLGIVSVVVELLKLVVSKPRPFFNEDIIPLVVEHEPFKSFPSGHVASLTIVLVILSFYYKKFTIPSILSICLMAYTRVYLKLHYPIDVISSIVISVVIGLCILYIYENYVVKKYSNLKIRNKL